MPSLHWQMKLFGPSSAKKKNCVQARVDVGDIALLSAVSVDRGVAEFVSSVCFALPALIPPWSIHSRPLPAANVAAVADAVGAKDDPFRDSVDVVTVKLAA